MIANNSFSNSGGGVGVDLSGHGVSTLEISNNTMASAINQEVIDVITDDATGDTATLNLTALNSSLVSQSRDALYVDALRTTNVCLNIRDNSATPGSGDDAYVIFGDTTTGATQLESGPTDCAGSACPDAVDHIGSKNTGTPITIFDVSLVRAETYPTPSTGATTSLLEGLAANATEPETVENSMSASTISLAWLRETTAASHQSSLTAVPGVRAKPLFDPLTQSVSATPGDTVTLLGAPFALPAGETFTVTFAVTITAPLPAGVTSVQNQATISGSNFDDVQSADPDPNPGFPPANGETITPINAAPDLSLSKDDGGVNIGANGTVTYTLTYSNTGTQHASGVVLTETVAAHTTFNAGASTAGWSCAPDNSAGSTCTLIVGSVHTGDPPATAAFAVDVAGPVPAGTTDISNTAQIGDDGTGGSDPTPANNTSSDNTPLVTADLVVAKSDEPDPVAAGETLTYTGRLTTTETGGTDAFTVTLQSEPAAAVTVSLSSNDPTEGTVSPTTLTFDATNWDAPQTVTVTGVDDDVDDGNAQYTVQISVSSDDYDYDGIAIDGVSVTNEDDDEATGYMLFIPEYYAYTSPE